MVLILARAKGSSPQVKNAALLLVGAMLALGCGQAQSSQCTDIGSASSKVSVSYAPDGGATSFDGSARQGPNLITKQFDPYEIQLFLSDVSECGGTSLPTREILMDVYAYALPQGAIPGTYVIGRSVGSSAFATFSATGLGDLQNNPSGSLTLTRTDSCVAEGSFQVSISRLDGGAIVLSGSFVAPFCAVK